MNKKLKVLLLCLACIVSLIGGLSLIKHGAQTIAKTQAEFQDKKNNKNIKEFEKQYDALTIQEQELNIELDNEFQSNGESEKYTELNSELKNIANKKKAIEFEISKIKNGYYDNKAGMNESIPSGLIYIIPGIILCMLSFILVIISIKKISE